jgi:uncharacterized protein YllA (UPF0747 family)
MQKWILENWEALLASGPIAALIAYLTTKKQRQVESLDGISHAYDQFVEDHNERYESIKKELKELKEEVARNNNLLQENSKLLLLESGLMIQL